jgi:hypothetical protein
VQARAASDPARASASETGAIQIPSFSVMNRLLR